jgi:hypothetical protein
MQVKEIPFEVDLPEAMARAVMPERDPHALHLTDVIRYIDNLVIHKGERRPPSELSVEELYQMSLYTSMGWAWEELIRDYLRKVYDRGRDPTRWIRGGPLVRDGIHMNPDWLDLEDECVDEFKATWLSMDRGLPWSWRTQVSSYCGALNVRRGRIWGYFVNGNYKPMKPRPRAWMLEFNERELHENWNMILLNATQLKREMNHAAERNATAP